MQQKATKHIIYAITFIALIIADQLSKWAITQHLFNPTHNRINFIKWLVSDHTHNAFDSLPMTSFFNLVMVWNHGISFGILNNGGAYNAIILSAFSILITFIFIIWLYKSNNKIQSSAFIFIISGALGNVIDRLRFGAVIDFLDFHVENWHWPAFNLADSFIFIGVALLMYYTTFIEPKINTTPKESK